jgi:hypothetical protein
MEVHPKQLPMAFYRSANGREPVRDWLEALSDADRRVLGYDIGLVEIGWPIGMPLCRALGAGLWAIRSSLPGNRIARVIFSSRMNTWCCCTASSRNQLGRREQSCNWFVTDKGTWSDE